MIVSLTGFMGSGKTSVGRKLSALLSFDFIDLDDFIVRDQGRTIPEIFSTDGESAFRQIECSCLARLLDEYESSGRSLVLSLGGGAVTTPECLSMVQKRTVCIYLKASPSTLRGNLGGDQSRRPVLKGNNLEQLLESRAPIYESAARHTILTDGRNVATIASRIRAILQL